MPEPTAAIAYLRTNILKHIVHLKMLAAYPDQIHCRYERSGADEGVCLLLPAKANSFDAHTYPQADFVVLLAASDPQMAARLVESLPRTGKLVFKLVDETTKTAVLSQFPARRVTAFISYTSPESFISPCVGARHLHLLQVQVSATRRLPGAEMSSSVQVIAASTLDERLLACFSNNGYTQDEMCAYFQKGARSFSIFDGDRPLSTCFIFENYETVWEIGGVYTDPAERRKGWGRRVVAAALADLEERRLTPRYQVVETNLASLRLAESLGMERFVTTEHFWYEGA